jgi:D-glycero-D-manno-heptose 1,7-bisphosphate phosphatase
MVRCVFLDRDGVLNQERGDYTYRVEDFRIPDGVSESLLKLKNAGFRLVVITNQSGIYKHIFTREEMQACHDYLNSRTGQLIDDIYYCPYPSAFTESLSRKPGTLLFERAIAKYKIDPSSSWMIGDSPRDIIPASQLGMKTIFIGEPELCPEANYYAKSLAESSGIILGHGQVINRFSDINLRS